MELSSLLLILAILAITLIAITQKAKSDRATNVPPGSFGWPIIGETYEFLYGKPEKFIGDRMKRYSPKVFTTKVFGEPTVVFCGASGNKFLSTNDEKLFQGWRPYSMQKLFRSTYQKAASASIPRETEVHFFRAPGFLRPEALVQYVGTMDTIIKQQLKMHWEGKQNVKVYDLVQLMTATLSSRFYLGIQDDDRNAKLAKLLDGMSLGLHSMPIYFPGTIFYHAKNSSNAIRKELQVVIKEKKAAIASGVQMNDILTHMIINSDPTGSYMPEHEIADKIMGLLVAGFSTPATALTFLIRFIGERPEVYERIRAEQLEISRSRNLSEPLKWDDLQKMKYTWNVALEVMRLVPPFQGTFREATTDFTFEGFTIPKGWKIYWSISTTNKNPKYFSDPENFEPTRFEQESVPPPYTNVPFGGGPRVCPGKEYARLILLTFIHNIVHILRWEVMVPNEKIIGSVIPIPAKGLPVRLQPHLA
ncbi:hypothetical protein RJ640_026018 [Escallonia rubra]|uniref:Cytochrome P450 n=1 Tax=Escallonia rubra TaxID=112253 RepID=A0AA88QYT4_9ASTE|nr:hypothetical protein RJ640_026018 [Escallonia rubra]